MAETMIHCLVVTPEKTVLDREATMVVVPAFDGELGILAGHAPTLARLGAGELRVASGTETSRHFIDGGFVQVRDNVVTVLTSRVREPAELNLQELERELAELSGQSSSSAEGQKLRTEKLDRVRAAIRLAQRPRD